MDEKKIFEVDATIDKKTYRWVMTHFHEDSLVLARVFWGLVPFYGLFAAYVLNSTALGLVLFFSGLLMNIAHYFVNPRRYDKIVEGLEKTGENVNHYAFYETYLERTNATGNFKFNYENLSALKEAEDNLIFYAEPNRIIVLPKEKIAAENQEFLRSIIPAANIEAYDKKHRRQKNKIIALLAVMGGSLLLMVWLLMMR
ncbi:MAG: YcxB family protein [Saccharofermentans sp.]|nr:YcxB family protein [Saccharofermentans sp.]